MNVFLDPLRNPGHGVRGQPRTTAAVAGFEYPEEAESLAMAREPGLWREDQQRFFPARPATGHEEKPEAIARAKTRFLHVAPEDEELVAE